MSAPLGASVLLCLAACLPEIDRECWTDGDCGPIERCEAGACRALCEAAGDALCAFPPSIDRARLGDCPATFIGPDLVLASASCLGEPGEGDTFRPLTRPRPLTGVAAEARAIFGPTPAFPDVVAIGVEPRLASGWRALATALPGELRLDATGGAVPLFDYRFEDPARHTFSARAPRGAALPALGAPVFLGDRLFGLYAGGRVDAVALFGDLGPEAFPRRFETTTWCRANGDVTSPSGAYVGLYGWVRPAKGGLERHVGATLPEWKGCVPGYDRRGALSATFTRFEGWMLPPNAPPSEPFYPFFLRHHPVLDLYALSRQKPPGWPENDDETPMGFGYADPGPGRIGLYLWRNDFSEEFWTTTDTVTPPLTGWYASPVIPLGYLIDPRLAP